MGDELGLGARRNDGLRLDISRGDFISKVLPETMLASENNLRTMLHRALLEVRSHRLHVEGWEIVSCTLAGGAFAFFSPAILRNESTSMTGEGGAMALLLRCGCCSKFKRDTERRPGSRGAYENSHQ
jgi:hypothetical protein